MKKLYIVMVSWNKGLDWLPFLREDGGVLAYEYKRMAKGAIERCYHKTRECARSLKIAHIPRKYFKVVEFSQTEETEK